MARVNCRRWWHALRSRALDASLISVAWFLVSAGAFVVLDRPFHNKLSRMQAIAAKDPAIAIISRSDRSKAASSADQRLALAKIIERIERQEPKAVIILERLDEETHSLIDQELTNSLSKLGKRAILFADASNPEELLFLDMPLPSFREKTRIGHNMQTVGLATHFSQITAAKYVNGFGSVRHVAVEAIEPSMSPETIYSSVPYTTLSYIIGKASQFRTYSYVVDERVRDLQVRRIDEAALLASRDDFSIAENTIFVIEPISAHTPFPVNKSFTPSESAEQTALQLYSLKNGTKTYILEEDLATTVVLICAMIFWLRRGVFGFGFALALSVAWFVSAYLLIPYLFYFSIVGPIALFFTFAGVSARRQAEKRGIAMAGKLHPSSNLPNSVSFREAAIDPGQLVFAINSDRFAHSKSKPAQFFERTFGQRLPKSVFQTSDTTLTALTDRATALKLVAKLSPSEWQSKALRAVVFKPRSSMGLDTVVGDLETRFAELRAQGVPFKFVDTNEQDLNAQQSEHAAHGQQLFREVLVYDMEAQTPIGALIEVPKADGDFAQIKQLIESRIKKQERQAAEGGPSRGLWLAIDHSLLRDSAAVEFLADALTQDGMQALMSRVLLRGFSQSHATGLELGSVRRLARSGIEIGSEGLEQDGHSFADLINVPAQVMSIDLTGLKPVEETASMLRAAKQFCDELARELYAENVCDAALAQMVNDAQVKYASGPAIAEFILGSDRANSDARAAV